ncbi:baseplate J/gp47 family protein [uncultured Fusobacterium sp.]|uniref:baseplate J/gp47 family protein n=1 Tax=uncultured Fusobacterium sp. TaxID=159267 RepID=UPI0027DE4A75|nr:baseplate J/gp47 family protein [uncultured Fusobacterium sp.]
MITNLETKGFQGLMKMATDKAQSKECFGENFNVEPNGDYYKLAASFITLCAYLEDKIISNMRGLNLYTAEGRELDDLLYMFPRRYGSKAFITCRVTANSFAVIKEKEIIIQTATGIKFENVQQFEIDASKTKNIIFQAVESGEEGNIKISMIEKVLEAPAGIIDVQNITLGEGGLTDEDDYTYLTRYLASNTEGEWALEPIINAVRGLAGVKSANGIRNNTLEVNKYGLEPKSIWIVVDGGIKEEIAEAIYNHIHTPDTKGNIEVAVQTSVEGKKEIIRFDRPVEIEVEYKFILSSPDELQIKKLLDEYINNAGLGEKLSTGMFISKWICGKNFEYSDFDLKFRKKGIEDFQPSLQLAFNERSKSAGEGI